jgi:hypothetical protein
MCHLPNQLCVFFQVSLEQLQRLVADEDGEKDAEPPAVMQQGAPIARIDTGLGLEEDDGAKSVKKRARKAKDTSTASRHSQRIKKLRKTKEGNDNSAE